MLANHASPAFESAITASPITIERRRPMRSIASPITSTRPYMPTMWMLMIVKMSPWAWPWPTAT